MSSSKHVSSLSRFWCFDIATHSWDWIDIKVRLSALWTSVGVTSDLYSYFSFYFLGWQFGNIISSCSEDSLTHE